VSPREEAHAHPHEARVSALVRAPPARGQTAPYVPDDGADGGAREGRDEVDGLPARIA